MDSNLIYLFVYGSLKKNKHNHSFLANQQYLGKYFTNNSYTLVISGLPFLVERPGIGCLGELYKVTPQCLAIIDRLEDHPDWYERKIIPVYDTEVGSMVEAHAYIHPDIFNKQYTYEHHVSKEY